MGNFCTLVSKSFFLASLGFGATCLKAEQRYSDIDLKDALYDALTQDFHYSGRYLKTFNRGYGVGCKKTRDFKLYWNATLKNLKVSINDKGVARFDFSLDQSKAHLSYSGKNSICLFKGYFGDVYTSKINGAFDIIPQPGAEPAIVSIQNLEISNLEFRDWTIFEPFLIDLRGDAPEGVNKWANKNFNKYVAKFLKSSFSDRFDRFVSKKIKEALDNRYEEDPVLP